MRNNDIDKIQNFIDNRTPNLLSINDIAPLIRNEMLTGESLNPDFSNELLNYFVKAAINFENGLTDENRIYLLGLEMIATSILKSEEIYNNIDIEILENMTLTISQLILILDNQNINDEVFQVLLSKYLRSLTNEQAEYSEISMFDDGEDSHSENKFSSESETYYSSDYYNSESESETYYSSDYHSSESEEDKDEERLLNLIVKKYFDKIGPEILSCIAKYPQIFNDAILKYITNHQTRLTLNDFAGYVYNKGLKNPILRDFFYHKFGLNSSILLDFFGNNDVLKNPVHRDFFGNAVFDEALSTEIRTHLLQLPAIVEYILKTKNLEDIPANILKEMALNDEQIQAILANPNLSNDQISALVISWPKIAEMQPERVRRVVIASNLLQEMEPQDQAMLLSNPNFANYMIADLIRANDIERLKLLAALNLGIQDIPFTIKSIDKLSHHIMPEPTFSIDELISDIFIVAKTATGRESLGRKPLATLIIEALAGGLILNQATIENLLEIPNLLATAIEQNQLNRLPDSIVYDYLGIHKVEKANRQSAEKLYHYLLNHNNDPRYDTMLKRCLTYSAKACIFHYKNVANRTPKFIELFVEYHPNEFVDTIDNPKLIEPLIKHDSPAISGQVAHFLAAKPEWHEVLDDETLYILMSVVKIDFENNEKIKDRIDQYCFRKVFSDLVTCIQDKSINPRLLLINLFSHTSKISSEMLQDYAQLAFSKNTLPELSPGNLITLDALNAALNYYNTDSVSSDAGDAFKHFKHFKQTIHYLHKKYKDIYGNETGLLHPKDDWEDWINVRYMRIHIYHVFPVSRKLDEPAASGNIATTTGFGFKSPEKQSSPARLGLFDKKNDPKKTKGNNTASEGTATATGFGFQNKDDNNDPAPPNFSAKAQ